MATIKQIALAAGVSYTTVSHVLNDTRPVSPAARERVLAAASALHYVPSALARSLRSQSTGTIGRHRGHLLCGRLQRDPV
jgi:LacI family transcriptional regulator